MHLLLIEQFDDLVVILIDLPGHSLIPINPIIGITSHYPLAAIM